MSDNEYMKGNVKDECGAIESTSSWLLFNAVTKTWDWRELEPGDLKTKKHTGEISSIRKHIASFRGLTLSMVQIEIKQRKLNTSAFAPNLFRAYANRVPNSDLPFFMS